MGIVFCGWVDGLMGGWVKTNLYQETHSPILSSTRPQKIPLNISPARWVYIGMKKTFGGSNDILQV